MDLVSVAIWIVLSILYVWTIYNIPILAVGLRRLRHSDGEEKSKSPQSAEQLPTISIITPVKNEEKVVSRLLDAMLKLKYPPEKREIIIVEDGSTDKTVEICEKYARDHPTQIRLVRRSTSNGKPSALNYGLKHAKGEIVGVFDADNVPEPNVLLKGAEYFEDTSVGAVQGRTGTINADEKMLTKIVSYEEAVRYKVYIGGKDVLGLFVPLTGSCYFVRTSVIEEVGGWDSESLSEDTEMAAKLLERGHHTRFAPDVLSWQESPANFTQLIRQRLRWFRGCMEVALHYGKLIVKKPGVVSVDAEMTLIGPYMLPLCLLSYAMTVYALFSSRNLDLFSTLFLYGVSGLSIVSLLVIGLALIYVARPRRISNLLWLPFMYVYWSLQIVLSLFAFLQILLRRQRRWLKTIKSGTTTNCTSRAILPANKRVSSNKKNERNNN